MIGETQSLAPVLPALKTLCICGTDRFVISFSDTTTVLVTSLDPCLTIYIVDDLQRSLSSRLAVFSRLHLLKFLNVRGIDKYQARSFAQAQQADVVEADGESYVASREESFDDHVKWQDMFRKLRSSKIFS